MADRAELEAWQQLAGHRAKVYEALADAGDTGLTETELRTSAPLAGMHIDSLIAEGHGIQARTVREGQGYVTRWVLTKDAWA